MAKTVSSALAQHLASEVTTLATCWRITRRDGVVLGFTDHVRDLEVDGVTYRAVSGYTRTAIRGTADFAVDKLDVESVFSSDGTEEHLRAGKYDFAEVRMFLVNYQDLGHGILKLRRGWLGEVTIRDSMYVAELRGMTQRLQMTIGEVYAPDCSADLGDARCGVDLAPLEESGTVSTVISATVFETALERARDRAMSRGNALAAVDLGRRYTLDAAAEPGESVNGLRAMRRCIDRGDAGTAARLAVVFACWDPETWPGDDTMVAECTRLFDSARALGEEDVRLRPG
jgi:uncharacterized phage protein (TIGR02218 family)